VVRDAHDRAVPQRVDPASSRQSLQRIPQIMLVAMAERDLDEVPPT
jgi:hypothetical protein